MAIWWVDHRNDSPCCLLADDAEVEAIPEDFECETCEVRDRLDRLDPENTYAWSVFQQAYTRLAFDGYAFGEIVRRLTAHLDGDDFADLWCRMNILYDVLVPPPPTKGRSD
jgi:hypothetical protein